MHPVDGQMGEIQFTAAQNGHVLDMTVAKSQDAGIAVVDARRIIGIVVIGTVSPDSRAARRKSCPAGIGKKRQLPGLRTRLKA